MARPSSKSAQSRSSSQRTAVAERPRSFRRAYTEDYRKPAEEFGFLELTLDTFKMIWRHRRLLLSLVGLGVLFCILFSGIISEDSYRSFRESLELTHGDLSNFKKSGLLLLSGMIHLEATPALAVAFLLIWLITIYILRHIFAKKSISLRDAIYNACAPILSCFVVFALIVIESLPLVIVAISYSAAVATDFLATPFYALLYFVFATLLILLSTYLLAHSSLALVATTAPGIYPIEALHATQSLVLGRRVRIVERLLFLALTLVALWVVVMLPLIILDLWLKHLLPFLTSIPFVSLAILTLGCFSFEFIAVYLYMYYRRILDAESSH